MRVIFSAILFSLSYTLFSQSTICQNAEPFCAGNSTLVFPNTTDDPGFGSIGCLLSTPNPAWFYIQIDEPGDLFFEIIQSSEGFNQNGDPLGALLDVDFALWGPYENLDVCQGNTPPLSDIIDCSYSSAAIENTSISNAETGEYYIVLLTNFANITGSILLNQTGGSGATDCSIVDRIEACEGDIVSLDATTEGATNYIWEFDNGTTTVEIANGDVPVLEVEEEGTYIVTPEDSLGNDLTEIEFNLIFFPYIELNEPEALEECENEAGKGFAEFNLQEANASIFTNTSNASFSYYLTENGAINEIQEELLNINYTNIEAFNQSIFVRVAAPFTCPSSIELQLNVLPLPELDNSNKVLIYCLEDLPNSIVIDALSGNQNLSNYQFLWSTNETSQTLEINQAGAYSVEIINSNSSCSVFKTFEVIESSIADFEVNVEDSSRDNKSIEISLNPTNSGIYEYALNEPVNFQESNRFENLNPGEYIVFVRDQLGCGISQKTVSILGIMEFFTPNGDGINDIWTISGFSETNQENIQLAVYDRYGKLLSSFTSKDRGWDGTYNGENMPTDDYWFRIQFSDGRVETGNFTLKR
jgi:gliding motility-associated-like protein